LVQPQGLAQVLVAALVLESQLLSQVHAAQHRQRSLFLTFEGWVSLHVCALARRFPVLLFAEVEGPDWLEAVGVGVCLLLC